MSDYVRAAGRFAPTRAYDFLVSATMRERRWRPALVAATLRGLDRGVVLDVGAGTGSLAIMLADHAEVIAVDGDAEALAIARAKPGAERVSWQQGFATALPLGDDEADRVVMSLLLHHLTAENKRRAIEEACRVVKPGGRLLVADWGRPQDPLMVACFLVLRAADGMANTAEHARGCIPGLISQHGFAPPVRLDRLRTSLGTLELLAAEPA